LNEQAGATDLSGAVPSAPTGEPTLCAVCGTRGFFPRGDQASTREGYPCTNCGTSLRYRDQATLILDEFGRGQHLDIGRLVRSGLMNERDIYEPALRGPFVKAFGHLPRYRRSFYWDEGTPGAMLNGVPFEDLTALSFANNTFDLVITSDVMEHVIEPWAAFREIARVLKPGGVHIFSIPTDWPFPASSIARAKLRQGDLEHLLPPRYHRGGDDSQSLVVTDFGADVIDELWQMGLSTQIVRRSFPAQDVYRNATFVARKLMRSA
jgi:SAM-dependent methyltransferase